jgi:hypothetical protein
MTFPSIPNVTNAPQARDLVATRASPDITRDYDSTFAPAIDADADADEDENVCHQPIMSDTFNRQLASM